jgi:hypothetical protein
MAGLGIEVVRRDVLERTADTLLYRDRVSGMAALPVGGCLSRRRKR